MPQQLPFVPSIPNYRVSTDLAGTQFILDARWNTRSEAWYLDILVEDETPIVRGVKVVLGALLGVTNVDPAFPAGTFLASDTSGQGLDATLDDLGTRVIVLFFPDD